VSSRGTAAMLAPSRQPCAETAHATFINIPAIAAHFISVRGKGYYVAERDLGSAG
jgi:hypothetical protein